MTKNLGNMSIVIRSPSSIMTYLTFSATILVGFSCLVSSNFRFYLTSEVGGINQGVVMEQQALYQFSPSEFHRVNLKLKG